MAMERSAVVSPAVNRTSIDTISSVAPLRKRIDQHRYHHPQQQQEQHQQQQQEQQNKRPRTSSSSSYVLPYNAQFVSIDVRGLLQQARSAHHTSQQPSPLKPSSACTGLQQQQQQARPAHHTAQQPSLLKPSSTGWTASPLPPASTAKTSSSPSRLLSQPRQQDPDWPSSSDRDWNRFLWALDDKRAFRRLLLEQVPYQPVLTACQDIIPDYVYTDDVVWDLSLSEVALL